MALLESGVVQQNEDTMENVMSPELKGVTNEIEKIQLAVKEIKTTNRFILKRINQQRERQEQFGDKGQSQKAYDEDIRESGISIESLWKNILKLEQKDVQQTEDIKDLISSIRVLSDRVSSICTSMENVEPLPESVQHDEPLAGEATVTIVDGQVTQAVKSDIDDKKSTSEPITFGEEIKHGTIDDLFTLKTDGYGDTSEQKEQVTHQNSTTSDKTGQLVDNYSTAADKTVQTSDQFSTASDNLVKSSNQDSACTDKTEHLSGHCSATSHKTVELTELGKELAAHFKRKLTPMEVDNRLVSIKFGYNEMVHENIKPTPRTDNISSHLHDKEKTRKIQSETLKHTKRDTSRSTKSKGKRDKNSERQSSSHTRSNKAKQTSSHSKKPKGNASLTESDTAQNISSVASVGSTSFISNPEPMVNSQTDNQGLLVADLENWLEIAENEAQIGRSLDLPRCHGPDTVLLLDTSASMDGQPLQKMKSICNIIITGIEELAIEENLEENLAIVTFGKETKVVHHMTNDYNAVKACIDTLGVGGPSPLMAGLGICLAAIYGNSSDGRLKVGEYSVCQRIILITDGHPTDSRYIGDLDNPEMFNISEVHQQVYDFVDKLKQGHFTVSCVPVGNCNQQVLQKIADISHGKVVLESEIQRISRHYKNVMRTIKLKTDIPEVQSLIPEIFGVTCRMKIKGVLEDDIADMHEILHNPEILHIDDSSSENEDDNMHTELDSNQLPLGTRVERGPDWKWNDQDSEGPGTVVGHKNNGVFVEWDNGQTAEYRYGPQGYDVIVSDKPRILHDELIAVGCMVQRGKNWRYGDQDGGQNSTGVVFKVKPTGEIFVRWSSGVKCSYKYGHQGFFEVEIIDPSVEKLRAVQDGVSNHVKKYRSSESFSFNDFAQPVINEKLETQTQGEITKSQSGFNTTQIKVQENDAKFENSRETTSSQIDNPSIIGRNKHEKTKFTEERHSSQFEDSGEITLSTPDDIRQQDGIQSKVTGFVVKSGTNEIADLSFTGGSMDVSAETDHKYSEFEIKLSEKLARQEPESVVLQNTTEDKSSDVERKDHWISDIKDDVTEKLNGDGMKQEDQSTNNSNRKKEIFEPTDKIDKKCEDGVNNVSNTNNAAKSSDENRLKKEDISKYKDKSEVFANKKYSQLGEYGKKDDSLNEKQISDLNVECPGNFRNDRTKSSSIYVNERSKKSESLERFNVPNQSVKNTSKLDIDAVKIKLAYDGADGYVGERVQQGTGNHSLHDTHKTRYEDVLSGSSISRRIKNPTTTVDFRQKLDSAGSQNQHDDYDTFSETASVVSDTSTFIQSCGIWEWQSSTGEWVTYSSAAAQKIEKAHRRTKQSTALVDINGEWYRVVVSKMIHIHAKTRKKARIRRLDITDVADLRDVDNVN